MNTDLIYSDFAATEKSPFFLTAISGSVVALSDDLHISPTEFIPIKDTPTEDVNTVNKPPKVPFLTNVYIGSLTVVGLFVLFRFIQKHP